MPDQTITLEAIRRAFPARIAPVKVTWYYRAWLSAVLAALILLQAAYLALIALAAWITVKWTLFLPSMFAQTRSFSFAFIIAVFGPPIIGTVVVIFLIKPILARPPKPEEPSELNKDDQPDLFAFVEELCRCLGAPPPRSIVVSLDVNASAGLRGGMRSLLRNDLRLVIGLQLVAGLSLRQLAGVLAHEFGHFSQTAGIRSWFLIQSIQHWFARVAYDRDKWDIKLEQWQREAEIGVIQIILLGAVWTVYGSRQLLRLLMKGGALVSCAFSRQMEYDADHYEAALVGAETFEETSHLIPQLAAAAGQSWAQINDGWRTRRLSDDFPMLVHANFVEIADADRQSMRSATLAETTERFGTHPSTPDRIANVRRVNPQGQFALDGPATRLFRDFEGLCVRLTAEKYEKDLGDAKDAVTILDTPTFIAENARRCESADAKNKLFGNALAAHMWWRIDEPCPPGEAERDNDEEYRNLLARLYRQLEGAALLDAGVPGLELVQFDLYRNDLDAALSAAGQTKWKLGEESIALRQSFRDSGERLNAASGPERDAFAALSAIGESTLDLRACLTGLHAIRFNYEILPAHKRDQAIESRRTDIAKLLPKVLDSVRAVPVAMIPGTLDAALTTQSDDVEIQAAHLLELADSLAERLLDRLCLQAAKLVSGDPA